MRYLSKYINFFEADEISDDILPASPDDDLSASNQKVKDEVIDKAASNIKEYKQKKSIIDSIFSEKGTDDAKINLNLQNKVYSNQKDLKKRNIYLTNYESIKRLERSIDKINKAIDDDMIKKSDTNKIISDFRSRLSDITDQSERDKVISQIKNNELYIKKIDDNIKLNSNKITSFDKGYKKKLKDFDIQMKAEYQKVLKT